MDPQNVKDLENSIKKFDANFTNYSKKIFARDSKWEQYEKQYKELNNNKNKYITLNIGGYIYHVNQDLLFSHEDYNFKKLVEDNSKLPNSNNEVFIDKPGKNFEMILKYLKTKNWCIDALEGHQKDEFFDLANEYGMVNIIFKCQLYTNPEGYTIIEIPSFDFTGGDVENHPCPDIDTARKLAKKYLKKPGDVCVWGDTRNGGNGKFWVKNAPLKSNKCTKPKVALAFILGRATPSVKDKNE